jgi:hypothetical protein
MSGQPDDVAPGCPYCDGASTCSHVLLAVDVTFRVAERGVLMGAFNGRWSYLCEEDPEADERDRFDRLLDEVDSFADHQQDHQSDSAPGMSSAYVTYYTASEDKTARAIRHFQSQPEPEDVTSPPSYLLPSYRHSGRRPHLWRLRIVGHRELLIEHRWSLKGGYGEKRIGGHSVMLTMVERHEDHCLVRLCHKDDYWAQRCEARKLAKSAG